MALLTTEQVDEVWEEYMKALEGELACVKADVRQAVIDNDTWQQANQAEANNALNLNYRNAANTQQKALLNIYVTAKKYNVEHVAAALLGGS